MEEEEIQVGEDTTLEVATILAVLVIQGEGEVGFLQSLQAVNRLYTRVQVTSLASQYRR